MHKKGQFAGIPIPIILGIVVILIVSGGLLWSMGGGIAQKIFGERGILPLGQKEGAFVPYTGPPLTEDERKVLNSANALRCALNSVAVGEFRPDDPKVCPPPLESVPQNIVQSPTGQAWVVVTGMAATPKAYDASAVQCTGMAPNRIVAPATEDETLVAITKEILDCKARASVTYSSQDLRCAYIDYKRKADSFSIDEDKLIAFMEKNKAKFPGQEKTIDELLSSANYAWQNLIEIQTTFNKGKISSNPDEVFCVDFRHGTVLNYYISINDCDLDASETFSCSVKDFELPQDVGGTTAKLFLSAYGDPRWLVYYESFPSEAAEYWHKEWSDMFNVWTIATVTASGMLNLAGGAGKGAKAVKAVAEKEAKELAKETGEALAKRGIAEAEKVIINRLAKNGVENTMKAAVMKESFQGIKGVGEEAADEITEVILKSVGTRSGPRAWEKAMEQGVAKQIDDVVEKRIKDVPDAFVKTWRETVPITELTGPGMTGLPDAEIRAKALQAYKESVKKFVIEGKELPEEAIEAGAKRTMSFAGTEVKGGLKELIERDLTKEMSANIIKKRAYENLLSKMITKEGTLDTALFTKNAESAINSLNAIGQINPTGLGKALGGSREILDILLSNSLGGFSTKNFPKIWNPKELFAFITAQSPIKLSGRGFVVGGTAVKTVANMPSWVATHSYPAMLLISWFIAAQDSTNQKFRPVGGNTIAINQPTLLGPTLPLDLTGTAYDFFIQNKDKYGQRMYYVSPCKADLTVYKRKCTCYKNPQLHKFTYPTGTINVEPGSVKPLSGSVLEAKFKTKWEQTAKAVKFENWRAQWNALDAKTKSDVYGDSYDKYALAEYIDEEMDKYDANFFQEVVSPVGGLVKGRSGIITWLAGTQNVQTGLSAQLYGERMKEWYDASHAIKRCDQPGFVKDVMNFGGTLYYSYMAGGNLFDTTMDAEAKKNLENSLLQDEYFKPDCLEIETKVLDGTYCYDSFPKLEWVRNAVTIASLAADAIIIGGSGGFATPLALLGTGILSAGTDVVLEAWEKWP
jgi:hypothetical protein